ncbi:MAG: translation elongation factor Ts [Pseudomonadota bacterium]
MATVTAQTVKQLRDMTGAGMMDCKTALAETGGDIDAAVDWLRKKGLAKAAKKSGRTASEGLVAVAQAADSKSAVLIEVNSETDFVARNDVFQKMVREIAETALGTDLDSGGDVEAIRGVLYPGTDKSIGDHVAEMVGQIGENLSLRRAAGIQVVEGVVATYVHSPTVEGAGKIGVLVGLESSGDEEKLSALGKQIAMHVAATRPLAARVDELDPEVLEREKSVLADQARDSGKPEEIINKMVEGRLRKFYEESVLLEQTFVIDGENSVSKVIEAAAGDVGAPITLKGFARLELGEGVEKSDEED